MTDVQESPSFGGTITRFRTVNFSKAGQKFTFGRGGPRFPPLKLNGPDVVAYDPPATALTRAASFGVGERFIKEKERKWLTSLWSVLAKQYRFAGSDLSNTFGLRKEQGYLLKTQVWS